VLFIGRIVPLFRAERIALAALAYGRRLSWREVTLADCAGNGVVSGANELAWQMLSSTLHS
jgi:hypothetical protein